MLDEVPDEIGRLSELMLLQLAGNKITQLPKEIGNLKSLERAAKHGFGTGTEGLYIDDNPLPDPYPTLISAGQPTATENVLAWLRGELDPKNLGLPDAQITPQLDTPPEPNEEGGPTFRVADGKLDIVRGLETVSEFDRVTQNSLHRRLKRQVELLRDATAKVGKPAPPACNCGRRVREVNYTRFC